MSREKDGAISFIQVICAFSVVILHTNGVFWRFSATERYWFSANIIECIFYFAVPIFFMITGITLINYQDRYSTKEYIKRRIVKVVIPYLFWSIFGICYQIYTKNIDRISFEYVFQGLLDGKGIISLYWFFPVLFCVYFSIPLYASIDKNKRKPIILYLFVTSFIINICIPFVLKISESNYTWPYSVSVVSGCLFYVVAGVLLYYYDYSKWVKTTIIFTGFLGLILHIYGTYSLSIKAGEIVNTYKGYNNFPCVIYSLGVFVALLQLAKKIMQNKWISCFINFISQYTFSLYLLHYFVMNELIKILDINVYSMIWRLGGPFLITAIVVGITYLLRKIPLMKKVLP